MPGYPRSAMESMTGFGSGAAQGPAGAVSVQVASVNHRQCRVAVRSDLRDLALEDLVRTRVQDRLRRGSLTVQLAVRPAGELGLDLDALRAAWSELSALAAELGAPAPRLEEVARLVGRTAGPDESALRPLIERALDEALEACATMRAAEGANLQEAFRAHHQSLFELKTRMAGLAGERVERYRDRLRARVGELLRGEADLDDATLARELALYADRIDVTEELVRLDSHLQQMGELIGADGPAGKRIEFLLQELGREVNTTAAKAADPELQALVVEAKHVLEQMKEQAANVV